MAVKAHTFYVAYCDRCRATVDEDGGEFGATPEQALAVIERHGWLQIGTLLICGACLDADDEPERRVVLCAGGHESEHDGAWHAVIDATGDESYVWLTGDAAACHCGDLLAPSGADHRAIDERAVPYLRADMTWTYLRPGGCGTGKGSVLWRLLGP